MLRGLRLVRRSLPPPPAAAADDDDDDDADAAEPRAPELRALKPRAALEAELEAAVGALRSRGFVNYFGMQRFGGGAVEVGVELLRGDCAHAEG